MLSDIGRHPRLALKNGVSNRWSMQQMESAILVERLDGPVRIMLCHSSQLPAAGYAQQQGPVSFTGDLLRIQNRLAQFAEPARRANIREIGPQVTAASANHMTAGAAALSKKYCFAGSWIPRY